MRRLVFLSTFCVFVFLYYYYFFLLTQLLRNYWTDFHQSLPTDIFAVLFVNGRTPIKIGLPKILGLKMSSFGAKSQPPPSSDGAARKRGGIL